MPDRREAKPAVVQIVSFLKVWGSLLGTAIFIIGVSVLFVANFEARLAAVEEKSSTDEKQNLKLEGLTRRIVVVEVKVAPITDQSWQKWGQVQKDVEDNAEEISDLRGTVWNLHSRSIPPFNPTGLPEPGPD